MSFLMVVAVFPLLLALLSLGAGLLVERLCGMALPAVLLPALGFAVLIVVSQFTTWTATFAPLTPWVLLALALLGFAAGWRSGVALRWRARAGGWWLAPAAGAAAYLTVASPIVAAGRLTFPGYLVDTTAAVQLAGAERLLHHGRDFTNGFPGYGATLMAYFGHGYPSGGHTVLASVGWLSGQDLLWLYAPFQAMELALTALVLCFLARRAGLPRAAAAFAGWIAAVPALVTSYALMGSIKELTALPMLMLMGALVVLAPQMARWARARSASRGPGPSVRAASASADIDAGGSAAWWRGLLLGVRLALPFALAAAAALGAIGVAASPWVGLYALAGLALVALALGAGSYGYRALAAAAVALGALTALLALPTLGPLSSTLTLAKSIENSNPTAVADPGNLLRPLRDVQALGVWLGGTHRLEPRYVNQTYLLIGVVAVCLVLGLVLFVRRRFWGLLAFALVSFLAWRFLVGRGTEWTDAKVLMLLSPAAMIVAMIGAFSLGLGGGGSGGRGGGLGGRRLEGMLLAGAIAAGVLGSDALAYHGTGLAPTQRYEEMVSLGHRFAGQGPTLLSDFDEYDIYLLRRSEPEGPGFTYSAPFPLVGGAAGGLYGHSYDLDSITQPAIQRHALIIMRNSPSWSRPPSNYALVWSGLSYRVYRRVGPAPWVHLGLGESPLQPVAVPRCTQVRALALTAAHERSTLLAAERPANVLVDLSQAAHSANAGLVTDLEGLPAIAIAGPARVEASFRVPAPGRYQLWLGGDADRRLHVLLDGRQVGAPTDEYGGDASKYPVATVTLAAGRHRLLFLRGGGSLRPSDAASTFIDAALFEPLGATRERVVGVAPGAWRSLCGKSLDWLEVK